MTVEKNKCKKLKYILMLHFSGTGRKPDSREETKLFEDKSKDQRAMPFFLSECKLFLVGQDFDIALLCSPINPNVNYQAKTACSEKT